MHPAIGGGMTNGRTREAVGRRAGGGSPAAAGLATVIVCTRNRPRELESCLAALGRQTTRNFDVLVVDNGSQPPVADMCARRGASYMREPSPGLCIARNAGARHAAGEIIAYIDDDAVPEPEWMETLLAGFSDDSVAAVTGRIRYMKSSMGRDGISDEEATEAGCSRPGRIVDRGMRGWFALASFGGVGDGSNMAFRRDVLLDSPGFDNRLGRGRLLECGDEHVIFMSILALGHRIAHVPEAVVRHPYPAMRGDIRARRVRDRRASIAYLIFLWNEFPAHRPDLRRHLAGAVARRLAPSRASAGDAAGLGHAQALWAALLGVALYRNARREWAAIPAPDYRGLAVARTAA